MHQELKEVQLCLQDFLNVQFLKIIITIFGLLNGGFMLLDGIFVTVKGKYIGSEKPGPWAEIFHKMNVDVFKLGWLFILYGLLWLIWIYALWTNKEWTYTLGLTISILTMWYLPVGTLISIIVLVTLLFWRHKIRLWRYLSLTFQTIQKSKK